MDIRLDDGTLHIRVDATERPVFRALLERASFLDIPQSLQSATMAMAERALADLERFDDPDRRPRTGSGA